MQDHVISVSLQFVSSVIEGQNVQCTRRRSRAVTNMKATQCFKSAEIPFQSVRGRCEN